jgi:class 3 adenylate cyclase
VSRPCWRGTCSSETISIVASDELPRGTVTFLFTDIERSTELARQLGADFGPIRSEHHRIMRAAINAHGGHEIDTAGDGFFVAFGRAGDAVAAALAAQRELHASESRDIAVRVRMGLHSAEPFVHEGSYHGVGVHRAARICAAGHGGQILLSNATAGIVEDLDLPGVVLVDLGEHRLKDLEQPQRLVQVVGEGLLEAFPPLRTEDSSLPTVVTLFHADVAEFAAVLPILGDDQAGEAMSRFRRIVVDVVRAEGGREREVYGDKVWATFDRPLGALRSAVRARQRLGDGGWFPGDVVPKVRWGIHSGRVGAGDTDVGGSTWLRCTELCMSAEPDQILVSESTEALLVGEVHELVLRELGERTLRDVERPMRVFELEP